MGYGMKKEKKDNQVVQSGGKRKHKDTGDAIEKAGLPQNPVQGKGGQ